MIETPRYSIRKYIILLVLSGTIGFILGAIVVNFFGNVLGLGAQGVLIILIISFPFILFSVLYGFYKGLVRYYGLEQNEKLFFGGRF